MPKNSYSYSCHSRRACSYNQSARWSIAFSSQTSVCSTSCTVLSPEAHAAKPVLFPLPDSFVCQSPSRMDALRDMGMMARFPSVRSFRSRCRASSSEAHGGQLLRHFFGIRCSREYVLKLYSAVELKGERIPLSRRYRMPRDYRLTSFASWNPFNNSALSGP